MNDPCAEIPGAPSGRTGGAGVGVGPAGRPPPGSRRRRLALAAAGLVSVVLVAACSPPHQSAPGRAAHQTGPQAGSPAPSTAGLSTAGLSTVHSPEVDPAPLPDRPLARAAFLYARCNPMNVEDENCRFRIVLSDGSQYTLPKSVMHEGPGPISPDGATLLLYDESDGLVLRRLTSGTSRTVAVPDGLAAWGPVFWSPGARWAAVSADGPDGEKVVVVDIAGASVRRVEDPAAAPNAQLVAVSAHGDPIWAEHANAGATTAHWIVGGRQPHVVDADLRSHLRPGEIVNPAGWPGEVMLGDGMTAVVPIIRASGQQEAPWADGDAILLVDLTTGVARHRLDLPAGTARVRLHSSGCGLGPDDLVQFEGGDPTTGYRLTEPTDLVALDPRTGARGSGYRLPPEKFPLLIC